ncbi:MAG: aminotransferase class V-fold PLP-dependent enzyme [Alphaproteobacteria bacterium]|nr:aminotransferase class V-fold PLP-dependent enzyme [Alphaproteobacteria bacterium]
MNTDKPLFDPADFRIPEGVSHVCAGGEPPFLFAHDAALLRYAEDKSSGMPGRTAMEAEVNRAQARVAARWGAVADEIGFVSSVADGVAMVAESLEFRPGDNIVVDALEYPSIVAPFAMQRHPKLEIRVARGTAPDRLEGLIDARTRVIGASCVSYMTGERFDIAALRRAADKVGALLVVDFTQAAGWMPIDATLTDFAFAACYKWLLGTTGTAIAYWNRTRQPDWVPTTAGWHSIAGFSRPDWAGPIEVKPGGLRFTRGNPAHGPVYVLNAALDYLDRHDQALLHRHVSSLTAALIEGLTKAGIPLTTPADPARHGANVCMDSSEAQAMCNELHARKVFAWNGHGRLRFSFHGYNAMPDVTRILAEMPAIWRP